MEFDVSLREREKLPPSNQRRKLWHLKNAHIIKTLANIERDKKYLTSVANQMC